ncbi:MAG: histidine kinase, partial [Solirubrobacteraceae bacterium]
ALPFLSGRWANGQARLQRKVEERAVRLERDRERAARQAAEEERMRIAADLQGAIAGSLREIAADAGDVPGRLAASEHAEVRERLAGIASTAREALADVRRVLGVLRRDPEVPWVAEDSSPEPPRGRRSPIAPAWSDRVLVAVLLVGAEIELALRTDSLLAALTPVAIVAPLLLRRRRPVTGALAVLAAIALQSTLLGLEPFPVADGAALVCAVYAIGAYAERRRAIAGIALVALGDAVHAAVFNPEAVAIALLGGAAVPWTLGRIVRAQRRLTGEVRQEAAQVERRRALEEQAAVTGERMRVARELHDAVAHNISVIAIQAAGATGIVDRDPERAIQCAQLIEAVARDAIVELGRLAGPEGTSGAPGLARVESIARRARDGGLPVELRVEGSPVKIPAGVDLAAFRIVQEALANASKHAGDARARVVVRYRPRAIELEIADDGRGPNGSRNGSGHGLIGMRERVALYGGTLDAGRRPGGGFEVRARLPLGAA